MQLVFHSFHAGGNTADKFKEIKRQVGERFVRMSDGSMLPEINIPATMKSYAANTAMWISCPNSSKKRAVGGPLQCARTALWLDACGGMLQVY